MNATIKTVNKSDFTTDILEYLRTRRGQAVPTLTMIGEMTRRVKGKEETRRVRGKLLSDLAVLTREKKVIRYRRASMSNKPPWSSQGLVRISEVYA